MRGSGGTKESLCRATITMAATIGAIGARNCGFSWSNEGPERYLNATCLAMRCRLVVDELRDPQEWEAVRMRCCEATMMRRDDDVRTIRS